MENDQETAWSTGPALRDVLKQVKCPVKVRIEDRQAANEVDVVVMHGRSGPILAAQLNRSRLLPGMSVLACRPLLNVTTAGDDALLIATVRLYDEPPVVAGRKD